MTAIICHGTFGHSKENWFPWLKKELEKIGETVFVPDFPNPTNPKLDEWLGEIRKLDGYLTKDAILIGHSLGCILISRKLEKVERPIKACFLVAGFTGPLDLPVDENNKDFLDEKFDWAKIRKNCKKFVVFYSDNDPFVPAQKTIELVKKLGAEKVLVKGAGHFNAAAGYTKFQLLLEKIKKGERARGDSNPRRPA